MKKLFLDFESYYDQEYSLRKITPVEYVLSPQFELLGCAFKEDQSPAYWVDGPDVNAHLATFDPANTMAISHNWLFDGCICNWGLPTPFNPVLAACTMNMARSLYYHKTGAVSLDAISRHLGLGEKFKTILKMKGMSYKDMVSNPPLHKDVKEYGIDDVEKCASIFYQSLPEFPVEEFLIMDITMRMATNPQFILDPILVAEHLHAVRQAKEGLMDRCGLASREDLMSNEKFAVALRGIGVEPPTKVSVATGKVAWAFAKTDAAFTDLEEHPNPDVQALVAARLGIKTTIEETRSERLLSISRLEWPKHCWPMSMPIPLRYSGAHTHRLSGDWKVNAQNLARRQPDGSTGKLRLALQAPRGYKVVSVDSSQIECRLTATLAGAENMRSAFEHGEDIYAQFASEIYDKPVTKKDNPVERFVGKQAILGLGYGMGWPRFARQIMSDSYNQGIALMPLETAEATRIVKMYRQTYAPIPRLWDRLDMALRAIQTGQRVDIGPVYTEREAIVLPNGHRLFYRDLKLESTPQGPQWMCVYGKKTKYLWGGKLLENIIQALARIVTLGVAAQVRRRFPNLHLAHQVHDELIYVVPDAAAEAVKDYVVELMCVRPAWMPTVPLAAEGGVGQSYGEAK